MSCNARNDEIRDNVTRMRRGWEAQCGALVTVRRFNATLSAKGHVLPANLVSVSALCRGSLL